MANWSSISIIFKGNIENLGITEDVISKKLGVDASDLTIDENGDSSVLASARYSTDILKISEFADNYSLTFVFEESEPGYNYYTKIVFEDGIQKDFVEAEYFSADTIDYHGLEHFIDNLFCDDDVNRHIYNVLEEAGELDDEIKKKAIKILMENKDEN